MSRLPNTKTTTVSSTMRKFTHYYEVRISDNDTLDMLYSDGKLQFKMGDDTYHSLVSKTVKGDEALGNDARRATNEKL